MLAAGAGAAYLLWLSVRKAQDVMSNAGAAAIETVYNVGQAINPINQDNIFYSGVNAVGGKLTGDSGFTLGGWIYDATH